MRIVIPSTGRCAVQPTLEALPETAVAELHVHLDEIDRYARRWGHAASVVGLRYHGIREKRQHVLDTGGDGKLVMMDDDLRFRARRADGRFERATAADVEAMLAAIEKALDERAHVGIADEFMCQHNPVGAVEGRRYNQVLGYNFGLVEGARPKFRFEVNEEHDMHLQLLRLGHVPLVLTDWTKSSRYQAAGGCSTWRTAELERSEFHRFALEWSGVVSVVPNKNSISGLATRVNWRRARCS